MADLGALLGAAGIGTTIGQAIVRLELDTGKYQTELAAAESRTRGFGAAAGTAFAAVGVAAVAGLAVSVKAAIEANDAHLKLQNTFANNARLSDSSVEAFEKQADSLRDLTGVDDEAIIRGQALLGQFRLTGEQVLKLTPLIVDLSEKMGIDLEAAAKAVGKATEGNTGALARYVGTIEAGATPTETYANILEKLGRVQGFAAESAEAEPWRVLSAQFEEVAEQVGQALLPSLQQLAEGLLDLVPILEKVLDLMNLIPQVHLGEQFSSDAEGIEGFAAKLVDNLPLLGSFVDLSEDANDALKDQRGFIGTLSDYIRSKFFPAVDGINDKFEDLHFTLEDVASATKLSRGEFTHYFNTLERNAEDLRDAARELRDEKWLDPDFVDFLSTKGPQWLVEFADKNETQQRRIQDQWEESNQKTKNANTNLDTIRSTLDKLDKGESRHKVIIEYDYVGFDPSKPGMGGNNNTPSETRRP